MSRKKTRKHKKKNRFASFFLTLGIILCVGVIAYSGYKLVTTWLQYRAGDEEYDRLRTYTEAVTEEDLPEKEEEEEEEEEEEVVQASEIEIDEDNLFTRRKPPIKVNWKSLKKINKDIVGWLYIESVDISYPVVKGKDDDYYLHRTFEKQDNFAGSIFVEAKNRGDFTDPNTIVYGHNMLNGSMFGKLSDLTDKDKYKEDPYFWILTPKGNYRYRMFSLHVTGVTSEVYTLFGDQDEEFLEWCAEMKEQSAVEIQDEVFTEHSRVVTLSTCTGDSSTRYVVQGQAVKD